MFDATGYFYDLVTAASFVLSYRGDMGFVYFCLLRCHWETLLSGWRFHWLHSGMKTWVLLANNDYINGDIKKVTIWQLRSPVGKQSMVSVYITKFLKYFLYALMQPIWVVRVVYNLIKWCPSFTINLNILNYTSCTVSVNTWKLNLTLLPYSPSYFLIAGRL